jgi:5-carboxymethyl-2-hydroxymuconate isomerase
MPHIIVEYTGNIASEANADGLLKSLTSGLAQCGTKFPVSAIRARAIELQTFFMADGADDYAFVHIELRVAPGRSPEVKQQARSVLLEAAKTHFAELLATRPLALTLELTETAAKSDKFSNFTVGGVAP